MLNLWLRDLNTDFTLNNCLFGSVKLAKNDNLEKYKYSSYGLGFDSRSEFSLTVGSMDKSVITFGVDMSSSVHIDNKNRDILIFVDGSRTVEAKCPILLTRKNKICIKSTL